MPAAQEAAVNTVIDPSKVAAPPTGKPDTETDTAAPDPSFQASADKSLAKAHALNAGLKADAAANPKPVYHKLTQGDLKRAEVARPDYRVIIVNNAITLDDILIPQYWANVGNMLKEAIKRWPYPVIEVIWDDASKYVRLLVIDADSLWAKVKVIEHKDLSGAMQEAEKIRSDASLTTDYLVKRVSPSIGWCVIRNSDAKRLKTNLGSREAAEAWLSDFLKSLGR